MSMCFVPDYLIEVNHQSKNVVFEQVIASLTDEIIDELFFGKKHQIYIVYGECEF